jgi:hypothetical protein
MEPCQDGADLRTSQDPSHYGKYQVELVTVIPGTVEPFKQALESSEYALIDFDQWGLTYVSRKDPDLSVDVSELDDYGENTRVVLRKGRLSECDIDEARCYLEMLYRRLTDKNRSCLATNING